MNINQINALRKVASAREEASKLEKEAALNAQAIKAGLNSAKNAVAGAAKRTTAAFKHGGMKGGIASLKLQGAQAGKALANGWNKLDNKTKAGIALGGGALAGAAINGIARDSHDEDEAAPQAGNRGYRHR